MNRTMAIGEEHARRQIIPCILVLFLCFQTLAVSAQVESHSQLASAMWFDEQIGVENSRLIRGREYLPRFMGRVSDPFLSQRKPFPGSVVYDAQPYYNVALLYDIYQDILILSHTQNNRSPILMEFNEEEVSSFMLARREFERVEVVDTLISGVSSGYFELLAESERSRLLVKRRKIDYLEKGIREFRDKHLYFVELKYAKGALIPISSRKDFSVIFPEKSTDLKQYVRTNRLKPRPGRESDLIQVFTYCDPPIRMPGQ